MRASTSTPARRIHMYPTRMHQPNRHTYASSAITAFVTSTSTIESFILAGYGFFYNKVINSLESIKKHLETSIDARMQSMESSLSNNASSLDRLKSFVGRIEQMVKENTNKKK